MFDCSSRWRLSRLNLPCGTRWHKRRADRPKHASKWAVSTAMNGHQAAGIAVRVPPQGRMPRVVCDTKQPMTLDAAQHRSGKGSGDENFPVASWLVAPPHRRPIMAFYEFVRIADDIADHPTLSEADKLAHLDRAGGKPARPRRSQRGRRRAACGACRAQPVAAARAGPAQGVPPGRHQAPLRRLGRADRLLPLFGDAGRALRARRARREPVDLARVGQCLRGAADHQSSAGLREGLPGARPGLYPARCAQGRRLPRRGAGSAAREPAIARLPARACRPHRRHAGTGQHACRRRSTTGGCRWRSPPSSPWRGISCNCCGPGTR